MTDEIPFDWALDGKPDGGQDDYKIMDWRGDLDAFVQAAVRFAIGTVSEMPQVTIGHTPGQIMLGIRDWSGGRDARDRRIVRTRWFSMPYDEISAHPVSYHDLYLRFAALDLPTDQPAVHVPPYDPAQVPADDAEMRIAALLMTGRHVYLADCDALTPEERLRFVETVAALLPYGMRAGFSASTWTSGAVDHRIRLSFAQYALDDAHRVTPHEQIELNDSLAARYYEALAARPLPETIDTLARMTEPLGFGLRDRVRAVELLEGWSRAVTDDLPDPEFDLTIPRPWSRPRFALNAVIGTLTVLLVAAVAVRVGFNIASRAVPPAAAEAAAVPAAAAPKKSGGTAKEITVQTVRDGGAAGRTRDEIVSRLRGLGYEVRSGQAGLNWSGEPSVVIGYDLDILPDATGRPEEIRAALDGELATRHPDFTVLAPACTEPAGKGAARTLMVITKGVDAGLRFELGQAVSSLYPPRSAKTLPCA